MLDKYSEVALPRADSVHSPQAVAYLTTVYGWMFLGLALTSLVAWLAASSEYMRELIFGNRILFFGLLIAELVLVMVISMAINRLSAGVATALFLIYSAMNGLTLSVVLLAYTTQSVVMAFLSATCLFGTMSLYGYFTKRSLASIGGYLMVGLIAIIICMVINMFLGSSLFDFIISIVGVIIFLGLTAYDTQKILRLGAQTENLPGDWVRKGAIIGALSLYLDFINLFLYMLRFMGKNRN